MKTVIDVYKRTFDFGGRSSIREFGFFLIYLIVVTTALFIVDYRAVEYGAEWYFGPWVSVFMIVNYLTSLSLQIRRLHDADYSGWYSLIGFIPFVGPFILLVLVFMPGTKDDNRFGPMPER